MKIIVIGAGLGGLATAAMLAAAGQDVTVFERTGGFGGKMNQKKLEGYRFDTGPSLFTMPDVLRKVFSECGKDMDDYLELTALEPLCRYFYQDGTVFNSYHDRQKDLDEIERIAPEDKSSYIRFLEYSEVLYQKTSDAFLFNPLYSFSDLKNLDLFSFFGIDAFNTVAKRVDQYFESPYLKKFFKRFTTYNGSSPYRAPATLNVIPHVEVNEGGYYVKGGLYKIARSLYDLAEEMGVKFHFNSPVDRINTLSDKITGVALSDGREFSSDIVISNSDSTETIVKLLSKKTVSARKKRKASEIEPSCSGFVMLLGVDKIYPELAHHNIFFTKNYEKEFQEIFDDKVMPEDPTIYVANTSYSDPEHAPDASSNLFILVNAPYLSEHYDWKELASEYGHKVINELENRGLDGLSDHIRVKELVTPVDFYEKYRSNRGSIYGTSSNNRNAAFIRPRNKFRGIAGLYMTGGSTHPGGGIPLVMQSALNVIELIDRYEGV
ncbi:phytoene desaturase family protein [Balneola sp. MJW-20]|uniref:phytoene desaturase family protein n=1 Tax=Gracilimonas aurantiaca TaxID=3234185 RepID=UPI0034653710